MNMIWGGTEFAKTTLNNGIDYCMKEIIQKSLKGIAVDIPDIGMHALPWELGLWTMAVMASD